MADQDQGIFPTDYVTGLPTYGSSPDEPPKEEKKKKDPALDLQSDPIAAVNDFFAPAKPTQGETPKPTSQSVADEVAKDPTTAVNKFFGPTPQEKPTEQAGGEGIVQYIKDEWNKKPHEEPSTTQDAADVLISYAKDATPDELNNKYQKYLKESTPQELEKIQKAIPHWAFPDDQWQRLYEYQKSKPLEVTGKDVADIAKGVFSSGVGVVRGATKIAQDVFSTDPASNDALKSDVYSYLEPIMSLPETAGWMGAKALQGGFKATDWLGEKAGVLSPEETQRRAKARYMVDVAKAQTLKDSGENFYRRMATSPTTQAAIKSLIQRQGPSDESISAAHPDWTPDQIKAYKDSEAEKQATELTQQIAADQPALDEDVKQLGTFFTPDGLGMGDLSVVLGGANLAKGVAGLAREAIVPAAEIAAQNAAKVASNAEKIAAGVEKAQQPSWWGQLADTTKNLQEQVETFKEANPTLARIGEAGLEYAPAAVLGYEASGHEGTGALGAIAAVALGKRLGFGKAISELPTVVSDLDKARMLSAGGKIGTFEMAGALPEASKVTQALFSGGRGAFTDRFLQSFGDYATEGVNMTALGAATGVLTSQDKEEFKQTLETGLAYALGGKVLSKVLHSDPAVAARRQRQQDIDNHITFKTLDPNTQQNLTQGSDWSNVIRESYLKVANAEGNLAHAKDLGDKKLIDVAERDLKAANDLHRQNQIASPETQEAYRREVLGMVTRGNELANGSQRAGLRNAGISLLTTQQIYEKLRSRPENAAKTDAQLYAIADNSNGVYFEGNTVSMPAMSPAASHGQYEGVTFDPQKPTVVVNMDKVKNNMGTLGRSFFTTMSHEIGHALFAIPEFREANAKTEEMLFGKTYRDLDGTVYEQTTGAFSPKDLTDMFVNKYLGDKGYTPDDVKAFADSIKLWDRQNDRLDEAKTAAYMKEEILAGLVGLNLTPKIDNPGVRHMLDWGSLQTQNNVARNAINKVFAVGGKAPHGMATDALTGVTFTPQQLSANRQALRELHKLNGIVSTPDSIGVSSPSVSKLDFLANKGLWSRYGKDSGLLKHEMRATVYGPDGTAIGSTVLTDPNAKEGSWSTKDGQLQQDEGYGTLPAGVTVPEGGSVRVQKQIVMKADGQTPEMLSPKEAKQLQQTRAQLIRDALINSYEGEVGGFAPTSDDQLSMGGTFTAKQIQAIRDLPESHVPKSLKDNILRINDLVSKKQGLRMFIDYAAMMTDAGKYKAFSPKIYEIVPLGMNFSKDGNFYVTTASVTRMLNKAKLWQERLPGRLKYWNGDTDAFFRDFGNIYLKNWQEGRPGETGLDNDPNVALEKKNIFADFLNFATKETASLHDRSQIPRKRGDERGKDLDRIFMSVRADHIRDMIESSNDPLPIDVRKGKFNLSPARKERTEPMGGEPSYKELQSQADSIERELETTMRYRDSLRAQGGRYDEVRDAEAEINQLKDQRNLVEAKLGGIRQNEQVTTATYKDPRSGKVTEGMTHLEANPNAPTDAFDREGPQYGFRTTSGRIVPRQEAFDIAQAKGQLLPPTTVEQTQHFDRGVLHSGMFTPAGGEEAAGLRFSPASRVTGPNEQFTTPPTDEVAKNSLSKDKQPFYGAHRDLEAGTPVGLRIDIPAFERTGNYVVTVHEKAKSGAVGKRIGYDSVATVDNPTFFSNERGAEKIAGGSAKFPVATVEGAYNPSREIPADINDWTPVGYNPKEHSYFYDKNNDEVVTGGDKAISVGNTVFVKNPTYGDRASMRFSPASKLDEAHAAAIDSGDTEEAQRLVDEAAKKAGYTIGPVYHGTSLPLDTPTFTVFEQGKTPSAYGANYRPNAVPGFYFTSSEANAKSFAGTTSVRNKEGVDIPYAQRIIKAYLKIQNPIELDAKNLPKGIKTHADILRYIKENGAENDGLILKNAKDQLLADNYVVQDPSQIKSADPATYDNEGNLIPLSQRFDTGRTDIRFSPAAKKPKAIKPQAGYDDTYLQKALKDGKDGMVKLTRPIKPNEALPLLSQVPQITEVVEPDTFTWDRPANVILYYHDGVPITFKYDPAMLEKPVFKDVAEEHAGQPVQLAMADGQTATGGDMGGILHNWLKVLRTVKIKDPLTGKMLIGKWANNEWKPAKNMKDKVRMFGAKTLLTYLMGPEAHGSNLRSVRRTSVEIDNSPLTPDEKDTFLLLANKGVKTARTAELKKAISGAEGEVEKIEKALKKTTNENKIHTLQIELRAANKTINESKTKLSDYLISDEEKKFARVVTNYKSAMTSFKNKTKSEASLKKAESAYRDYLKSPEFASLKKEIHGKHLIKLGTTFKSRKESVVALMGLTLSGFNIDHILPATADFIQGRIHHILGSVELSENPKLGAVYLGDDPQQAKFMTPEEANAAAIFKASPDYVPHEAYTWLMLGPEEGNDFLNTNPKIAEEYFPDFRQKYAETKEEEDKKQGILDANEANLNNTMRDQKAFALIMKKSKNKKK